MEPLDHCGQRWFEKEVEWTPAIAWRSPSKRQSTLSIPTIIACLLLTPPCISCSIGHSCRWFGIPAFSFSSSFCSFVAESLLGSWKATLTPGSLVSRLDDALSLDDNLWRRSAEWTWLWLSVLILESFTCPGQGQLYRARLAEFLSRGVCHPPKHPSKALSSFVLGYAVVSRSSSVIPMVALLFHSMKAFSALCGRKTLLLPPSGVPVHFLSSLSLPFSVDSFACLFPVGIHPRLPLLPKAFGVPERSRHLDLPLASQLLITVRLSLQHQGSVMFCGFVIPRGRLCPRVISCKTCMAGACKHEVFHASLMCFDTLVQTLAFTPLF